MLRLFHLKLYPLTQNLNYTYMYVDINECDSVHQRSVISIDREFVTSAKKIANFNEFSEIKKFVKICTKIR